MVVLRQVLVLFTFASVFVCSVVFAESTQLGSQAAAGGGGGAAAGAGAGAVAAGGIGVGTAVAVGIVGAALLAVVVD